MENIRINEYLDSVISEGRYAFSLEELKDNFNLSEKAILQKLHRIKAKRKVVQLRKGFYLVITPQYSNLGTLPVILFIDDLMKHLSRKYYLGLFSAAALHGAAHQQPMESQIIIQKPPIRQIKNKKHSLSFFIKSEWEEDWLIQKKTETGYVNISSPELTIFDLISYHKRIGGFNRIFPIIEELCESVSKSKMKKIARECSAPVIQRLGYILEYLNEENLSETLYEVLKSKRTFKVPLSLSRKNREGEFNKRWNLIINTDTAF
ncbi:MAG: hypothetical protein GXO79_00050 [Chlorobi bacterium]|nr:hypothetical protein [Chlorobiota bacterium]